MRTLALVFVLAVAAACGAPSATASPSAPATSPTPSATSPEPSIAPATPSPSPGGEAPPSRGAAAFVYDSSHHEMVLFGGFTSNALLDDTWTWDGAWHRKSPVHHPPARELGAVAVDPATHHVLLRGGMGGQFGVSTFVDDSWAWDGTDWQQLSMAGAPAFRGGFIPLLAASDQRVLMLAPSVDASTADLYRLDGTTWTRMAIISPPAPDAAQGSASFTYDAQRKLFVYYTNRSHATGQPATYTFDGTAWTQADAGTGSTSQAFTAAPNAGGDGIVLFGGTSQDTWTWAGGRWQVRNPATAPRAMGASAFAYDEQLRVSLLFGGAVSSQGWTTFSDLWSWDGSSWKQLG